MPSSAELPGMLLAAVIVEIFSRKRTLAAGLLITGLCTSALIASPAQVGTLTAQTDCSTSVIAACSKLCVNSCLLSCTAGVFMGQQGRCHGRLCSVVHLYAGGVLLAAVLCLPLSMCHHRWLDIATLSCSIQNTIDFHCYTAESISVHEQSGVSHNCAVTWHGRRQQLLSHRWPDLPLLCCCPRAGEVSS